MCPSPHPAPPHTYLSGPGGRPWGSVCQFSWCKCSHHSWSPPTNGITTDSRHSWKFKGRLSPANWAGSDMPTACLNAALTHCASASLVFFSIVWVLLPYSLCVCCVLFLKLCPSTCSFGCLLLVIQILALMSHPHRWPSLATFAKGAVHSRSLSSTSSCFSFFIALIIVWTLYLLIYCLSLPTRM